MAAGDVQTLNFGKIPLVKSLISPFCVSERGLQRPHTTGGGFYNISLQPQFFSRPYAGEIPVKNGR